MKVSIKEQVFSTTSHHYDLESVLDTIQIESFREHIGQIRKNSNQKEARKNKAKLPMFYPCIAFDKGISKPSDSEGAVHTGIIQFDIDLYDICESETIITKLKGYPYLRYAFISPRGGVKFGVQTDLVNRDHSRLKIRHKTAYQLVLKKLIVLLGDAIKFDDSCESVHLGCIISSDPNAYYNPSPDVLAVEKEVETILASEQITESIEKPYSKQREYTRPVPSTIRPEDEAIIKCLETIPDNLSYDARFPINKAIISYFDADAEDILMSHWTGVEDQEKLLCDIQQQIDDPKNEFTIKTLFTIAEEQYNYEPLQKRLPTVTSKEPTYSCGNISSKEVAINRLEAIIENDFLRERKNKAVIVECGAGKTRTVIKTLASYLREKPHLKVGVFLKTNDLRDEFIEDLKIEISKLDACQPVNNSSKMGDWDIYHVVKEPLKIESMKSLCENPDSKLVEDFGTALCTPCWMNGECDYHKQFSNLFPAVRVYTYNRLFHRYQYDRRKFHNDNQGGDKNIKSIPYIPDFIIIDEDIVPSLCPAKECLEVFKTENGFLSIDRIVMDLRTGIDLITAAKKHHQALTLDLENVENEINKLKKLKSIELRKQDKSGEAFKKNQSKRNRLKHTRDAIKECLSLSRGIKTQSRNIWVQYSEDNEEHAVLVYGARKELHSDFKGVPILYMDASGDKSVIDEALGREFEFEYLRVHQQPNSKVFQMGGQSTFSKKSFKENPKTISSICNWVQTLDTKKLGLIRYMIIDDCPDIFDPLDQLVTDINNGDDRIGWFGNIRGTNKYEDCDTLIVLGGHQIPDYGIANLNELLFRKDCFDGMSNVTPQTHEQYKFKSLVSNVYRMKSGPGYEKFNLKYVDPLSATVSNHFDLAETYQAAHRLRLIHGAKPKTLYLLTPTVLDISIDDILSQKHEFGDQNNQVISHLKSEKFLMDSKKGFMNTFSWTDTQTKEFRRTDEKGSIEWLRNHRSLTRWTGKTTCRKKLNILSWHDQFETAVKDWLQKNGMEIRSLNQLE